MFRQGWGGHVTDAHGSGYTTPGLQWILSNTVFFFYAVSRKGSAVKSMEACTLTHLVVDCIGRMRQGVAGPVYELCEVAMSRLFRNGSAGWVNQKDMMGGCGGWREKCEAGVCSSNCNAHMHVPSQCTGPSS